jgi:rhodanese-related sulfurtransferase
MKVKFARMKVYLQEILMPTPQFTSAKKNASLPTVMDILPADLRPHLNDVTVIDVRQPDEWVGELGHIKIAQLVPLGQLGDQLESLLETQLEGQPLVFICKSGGRSARAADLAQTYGLKNVFNLQGGMISWSAQYPETLE